MTLPSQTHPYEVALDLDWTTGRNDLKHVNALIKENGWQENVIPIPSYDEEERLIVTLYCNHRDVAMLLKLAFGGNV